MSGKLHDQLNEQINHELYSSYLYLSMAAYFDSLHLPGFAHWMRAQSGEEWTHALKFFDFLNDTGGRVRLRAIDEPPAEFPSPLAAFERALEHERHVSSLIHRLCDTAAEERNHPAREFLAWFVSEQVEEEKSADDVVARLKMAGDSGPALLLLDRDLAGRKAEDDG